MEQATIDRVFSLQQGVIGNITALLEEITKNSKYYPNQQEPSKGGYIKRPDGLLVPERIEKPQVLVNEFRTLLLEAYLSLFKAMKEQIDSPLFSFAERTLFEQTTTWLFIEMSKFYTLEQRKRVAVLVLLQNHYELKSWDAYRMLKKTRAGLLTKTDLSNLGDGLAKYIGDSVLPQLLNLHRDEREKLINKFSKFTQFRNTLHNRQHGSPIHIRAAIDLDRPFANRMRHQTTLIYSGIQVLEYYAGNFSGSDAKKWKEPYNIFQEKFSEIKLVFDFLSKNHR